jgi:hypothetical protein
MMSQTVQDKRESATKRTIEAIKSDVAKTISMYFAPVVAIANVVTHVIQSDGKLTK